jgi:hypothetical protein
MKFRRWKSLREHAAFIANRLRKRATWYRTRGVELTPQSHTLLWQNKRHIISIICKAMAVQFQSDDDSPKLKEWKKGSVINNVITNICLITLCAQRSATLTQLAYVCEGIASREKVRLLMADGVKIGTLEKIGKDGYMISDDLTEELFAQSVLTMRHPDVVAFSQACVTFDNVERLIQAIPFDREEDHPLSSNITLSDALKEGMYPEINDSDEDDNTDR